MDKKERLRSIWTSADESYINAVNEMNKSSFNCQPNSSPSTFLERQDSSASAKSDEDNCSFAAVPNEFRPKKSSKEFSPKATAKVVDRFITKDINGAENCMASEVSRRLNYDGQSLKRTEELLGTNLNEPLKSKHLHSKRNGINNYNHASRNESNVAIKSSTTKKTNYVNDTNTGKKGNLGKNVSWSEAWSEHQNSWNENSSTHPENSSLKVKFTETTLEGSDGGERTLNYGTGDVKSTPGCYNSSPSGHSIKWNSDLISSAFQQTDMRYKNNRNSSFKGKDKNGTQFYSVNGTFQKTIHWKSDLCLGNNRQQRNICYERFSMTEENARGDCYKDLNEIEQIFKDQRNGNKPGFSTSIMWIEGNDFDTRCTIDSPKLCEDRNIMVGNNSRRITWMDDEPEFIEKNDYETGKRIGCRAKKNNTKMLPKTSEIKDTFYNNLDFCKNEKRVQGMPRDRVHVIRHEIKITHVNEPRKRSSRKKKALVSNKGNGDRLLETDANKTDERTKIPMFNKIKEQQELNRTVDSENESCQLFADRNGRGVRDVISVKIDDAERIHATSDDSESKRNGQNENNHSTSAVVHCPENQGRDSSRAKAMLVQYGKEISDLILGCHRSAGIFMSFYRKWIAARRNSIEVFTALSQTVADSKNKTSNYEVLFKLASDGGAVLTYVPNPYVVIAGKVLSLLGGVIKNLFSHSPKLQSLGLDEVKLRRSVEYDIDLTSSLYAHALQCSSQFQDTRNLIGEFHQSAVDEYYADLRSDPELSDFLRNVIEFKVTHNVFYKRFKICIQKLSNTTHSEVRRAFCTAFDTFPEAAAILEHLHTKFHFVDCDLMQNTWTDIERLFENRDSDMLMELAKVIDNSIKVLTKEQDLLEVHLKFFETHNF